MHTFFEENRAGTVYIRANLWHSMEKSLLIMPISTTQRFLRAYPPAVPDSAAPTAWHFPFQENDLLVQGDENGMTVLAGKPGETLFPAASAVLYLGTLDGVPCLAYRVNKVEDEVTPPKRNLRELYDKLDAELFAVAGYALHLLHFQTISRFDSVNGEPAEPLRGTWGVTNARSGHATYPPVSPAVLILVHDGADRVLLAQKRRLGDALEYFGGICRTGRVTGSVRVPRGEGRSGRGCRGRRV